MTTAADIDAFIDNWSPRDPPVDAPRRPKARVTDLRDRLVCSRRTGSIGGTLFLLVWLIGWSVGCVLLAMTVIAEPQLLTLCFAIPFWAAWIFVFCMVVSGLFGREIVTVDANGVQYERRAIVGFNPRCVPLKSIRGIGGHAVAGNARNSGIELRTDSQPIRFAAGLPKDELLWIADMVRRRIHELDPRALAEDVKTSWAEEAKDESDEDALSAFERAAENADREVVAISPGDSPVETIDAHKRAAEPDDCTIEMHYDGAELRFTRSGRADFTWAGFGGISFLCAFWNGIVSVFVVVQWTQDIPTGMFWFMLVFLIPFEIIGLFILLGWLLVAIQPISWQTWRFGQDVRKSFKVLGLGPTHRCEWQPIMRVEVRRPEEQTKRKRRLKQTDNTHLRLAMIGGDGEDVIELGSVTRAEAEWIASEVRRAFPTWFRRTRDR